jgi:hypothetical protein
MNLLTYQRPTNIVLSDSCPYGMGGFSIKTGRAWRYMLPDNHGIHNNTLEWLASVVNILIEHQSGAVEDLSNILALTDNSGCVAWIHRNNFCEEQQPVEAAIAHRLADSTYSWEEKRRRGLIAETL